MIEMKTDSGKIGTDRLREMAQEALECAGNGYLVGIFMGFERTKIFRLILLLGQTEAELVAALEAHPGKPIALIGWLALTEAHIQFQVWTFNEFLTDPWAKALLENFQTDYRRVLAEAGVRTDLVH